MSNGIQINPYKLTEARQARAYNISDLADLVGVTRQAISKYEQGLSNISPDILSKISKTLDFPISFFFKNENSLIYNHATVFYRSLKSSEEKERCKIRIKSNWTYQMFIYLNEYITMPKLNLPNLDLLLNQGPLTLNKIQQITNILRDYWQLGRTPIKNIISILEKNGFVMSGAQINATKTDACSEIVAGTPVIFFDKTLKSSCRIRFSIAHELGHIILHNYITNEDINNKEILNKIEKEANMFASCFLLPEETFRDDIFSFSLDYFMLLKEKWKVSIAALIYRCKELEIIDDSQVLSLRKKISYNHWNKSEPLDDIIPYEYPSLFKQAIKFLLSNSSISKSDIVDYFSFNLKDLSEVTGCDLHFWNNDNDPIKFSLI